MPGTGGYERMRGMLDNDGYALNTPPLKIYPAIRAYDIDPLYTSIKIVHSINSIVVPISCLLEGLLGHEWLSSAGFFY